ncbi:MAG: hypothetical protein ACTHJR_12270 [Sphingomonas sp.]|uniref:hypothetical protein n=1 Tax=Sphingomonas sp. TaxID=28214 RepID=UPI003F7E099B
MDDYNRGSRDLIKWEAPGTHTPPEDDPALWPHHGPQMLVGCKDMDQIKYWFPHFLWVHLVDSGYMLATYECPSEHVFFGKEQLYFNRHHAKRVKTEPLENAPDHPTER